MATASSCVPEDVVRHGSLHVLGPDGIIIWANSEELNTLGYLADEYIGKHIADYHCDRAVIENLLTRFARCETIRSYPARMKHADGSIVHVRITSSANRDKDGCLQHTHCYTSNVTSRILAEKERENEQIKKELAKQLGKRSLMMRQAELKKMCLALEKKYQTSQCLLNRIFPPAMSSSLTQGNAIEPQSLPQVTVFFSDIVGFTEIASKLGPKDVFALLNQLYTLMDQCAATAGVYKVETIGDAYMAVSGLQDTYQSQCDAMAHFALIVQEATEIVKNPLSPHETVKLRIGLHCGPVVAGVVGTLMPRYCLFGDTVNVASRMESTGEADRIHISDKMAQKLSASGRYSLLPRGEVHVKGHGAMKTWWLSPMDASLSKSAIIAIQSRARDTLAKHTSCLERLSQQDTEVLEQRPSFDRTSSSVGFSSFSSEPKSLIDGLSICVEGCGSDSEDGMEGMASPKHEESPDRSDLKIETNKPLQEKLFQQVRTPSGVEAAVASPSLPHQDRTFCSRAMSTRTTRTLSGAETVLASPSLADEDNGFGCSKTPDGVEATVASPSLSHQDSIFSSRTMSNRTMRTLSGAETALASPSLAADEDNGFGCSKIPDEVEAAVASPSLPHQDRTFCSRTMSNRTTRTLSGAETVLASPSFADEDNGFGCSKTPDGVEATVASPSLPHQDSIFSSRTMSTKTTRTLSGAKTALASPSLGTKTTALAAASRSLADEDNMDEWRQHPGPARLDL